MADKQQSGGEITVLNQVPTVQFQPGTIKVYDQGVADPFGSVASISAQLVASDFTLTATRTFSTIVAMLGDDGGNDNGVFDNFDGTLSWGIYADAGGKPGALLFSGEDDDPVLQDTGQNIGKSDLFSASVDLGNIL